MGIFKRNQKTKMAGSNISSTEVTADIVLSVTDKNLLVQLNMLSVTTKDLAILNSIQPIIEKNLDAIVAAFYSVIVSERNLLSVINSHSSVDRLKQTLSNHILKMFQGTLTDQDIERIRRIAVIHVRIGLEAKWYMCAFHQLQASLHAALSEHIEDTGTVLEATGAISKMMNLEQQIVLEAYDAEYKAIEMKAEEQKKMVISRVNETANTLAAISEQTNAALQEIYAQTKEIAQYSYSQRETAASAENQAANGKRDIDDQSQAMLLIKDRSGEISQKMKQLQQTSGKITDVVSIVTSIAEQTNLLALNAAIESARAGEYGKGFSVVASEVRKLAEETKHSVQGVSALIDDIHKQTQQMSVSISEVNKLTTVSADQMSGIHSFFHSITDLMSVNTGQSHTLQGDLSRFTESMGNISNAMSEIADTSDQLKELSNSI
ncbi:globin-coupled sensor protein [Bacillus lacus]|uniref:Globin-coupled sensor protein n=1 Tax=Metabacillus lacus TaxID=1983721 RepID=A0A7X2LXP5_9BACI|nr:globin-coupled sensor protein [Metabacillus lacus]MRX71511.1 globin-coupled sensor protein [Metabacillus lacus]